MKKTINSKIFKFINILLFSCFFGFFLKMDVFAEDDYIKIYSNIYNASSTINAEFEYSVKPDSSNPDGAVNEPTTVKINFDNISPDSNQTTMIGRIDFANTIYSKLGTYKYIISEVSSSNQDYSISSEKYEIYVVNTTSGKIVYQQAKNLDNDAKGDINFNHEPTYSHIKINLTVRGDEVDKQEYFRFKVYIDSLCSGCKYDMFGQDEYVRFDGQTIKTENRYVVNNVQGSSQTVRYAVYDEKDEDVKFSVKRNRTDSAAQNLMTLTNSTGNLLNYIYLKDGQSMTIGLAEDGKSQIPYGTLVKVIADESLDNRKWKMYIDGIEAKEFEHVVGKDIDFDLILERNMLVPNTGLFYEALPYILLILLGLIGFFAITKLKAKNAR